MIIELKRLADQLANDVVNKSDDPILTDQAEALREFIKSMPIDRADAIVSAEEWIDFEGMKYNDDGDEMETADEVEEKAVKFLQERGYEITD
jgi:hypothetical protein